MSRFCAFCFVPALLVMSLLATGCPAPKDAEAKAKKKSSPQAAAPYTFKLLPLDSDKLAPGETVSYRCQITFHQQVKIEEIKVQLTKTPGVAVTEIQLRDETFAVLAKRSGPFDKDSSGASFPNQAMQDANPEVYATLATEHFAADKGTYKAGEAVTFSIYAKVVSVPQNSSLQVKLLTLNGKTEAGAALPKLPGDIPSPTVRIGSY